MDHHGGKIAVGLLSLVVVWIIVFWLWTPTEAKISFSTTTTQPEQAAADAPARPRLPAAVIDPVTTPAARPGPTAGSAPARSAESSSRVPAPARGGGVLAPEFEEYTVQPGETFASIALKFFGSRSRADLIARANPLIDPTRIRAGRVIKIPRDPANIQGQPIARPIPEVSDGSKSHTVVKGDTLTGISQKYYGTIKHVDLLLGANSGVLSRAEDLRPGQVLKIPPAPR